MDRVAILGAGGFVGARFLETAVHSGRTDVVPVVRAYRSMARNAHLGVPHRLADASRPEQLRQALAGCDVVVNLTVGDPTKILRTTESIYEAAVAARASQLVHISSAAVYGRVEQPGLPDDARPGLERLTRYASEKALAESYLRARMDSGRIAITVLRPGLVWGPGSPWVFGPAVDLARGTAFLVADGAGICNLIYVDNLVSSINAVITKGTAASGFYHVADDGTTTWRGYYFALATGIGADPEAIQMLPDETYRSGLREQIGELRSLAAYRWLKERMSLETRAAIKLRIARATGRQGFREEARPTLNRALWEVQATRHRLPTAKFRATFGDQNRRSFASGMTACLDWLRFIGVAQGEVAAAPSPIPLATALSRAGES